MTTERLLRFLCLFSVAMLGGGPFVLYTPASLSAMHTTHPQGLRCVCVLQGK